MAKEKPNKELYSVKLIIEPAEEAIDFTDFVREVLEYQMARVYVIACSVRLEKPQDKPKGKDKSK